jgi:plastocyanin
LALVMLAWLIRFIFSLAVIAVVLLAFGSRQTAPSPVPPADSSGALPPTEPQVPRAPTREPFVERVVSRVARETQAPYPTATPLPSGAALVSIVDFGYLPGVLRIQVGQTVVWRNDGREEHDVTGADWHSGPMEPTVDYRQTFGVSGTFAFRCSIHPDMVGTLIVEE